MFDSERNKLQQRVLCNEIRRLPNETIKQLVVRIETLVRKAYSLNTHDYKNTKMTENLMMTLTFQLRKIAIKKRASHPSSIREPDLDFRKLVDKLEQAEITMKLEETENFKLKYVNRIETNITQINNIHDSDVDLTEKITEILNIYEKNLIFKCKSSFRKWCNYCRRYGHSIAECRQNQQDNQNKKTQKYKEPNKSFHQYMKKDQNLPNKNIHSNNSSGKPLPNNSNYSTNQSPYNSNYRGRSPEQRNSRNFSQNRYSRSNNQNNQYRNNYSRSDSNRREISNTSSHSNSRNRHYSNNRSRNSSYNRNRNYSNNRNRSYSNNRNQRYQNNRSRNNSYNRSNYQGNNNNYYNKSRNNSQNTKPNYNNQRNYSQSPYRNNNR